MYIVRVNQFLTYSEIQDMVDDYLYSSQELDQSWESLECIINIDDFTHKQLENEKECPICLQESTDVYISRCDHIICSQCISKVIEQQISRCPMCRSFINDDTSDYISDTQ